MILRILIALMLTSTGSAQTTSAQTTSRHAKGAFDVKMTPVATQYIGRMLIDKEYHGDLEGKAKGEMLVSMTSVKESAVYVAVETVTGKLAGKEGTFALHHTGISERGTQNLNIQVVPDSGTGDLIGITGKLVITITEGKHYYDLEYSLPAKP